MQFIKLFFSALILCICLDMLWLGVISTQLYENNIGPLLRKSGDSMDPNIGGALMVYLFIALGILVFVLPKSGGNVLNAGLYGALFGFIAYGIYDFTNYAVLANWPLQITLIDLCWGTFLCGSVSAAVAGLANWFK